MTREPATLPVPRTPADAGLDDHLVALPGSAHRWALWRCSALRGTGFTADRVLALAAPRSRDAAEALMAAEKRAADLQQEALDRVNRALDDLRAAGRWDDADARKPLLKATRKLGKGKGVEGLEPNLQAAVDAFLAAGEAVEVRRRELEEGFEEEQVDLSVRIAATAADPRFREAVVWQNRHAFQTALRKLVEGEPEDRNSQQRQHEELVASYLQRYTMKNDSIGFFGPVGWSEMVDDPVGLEVEPGPELLAERTVYLEAWALDALARHFLTRPNLKRWLPPRLVPYARLEGDRLQRISRQPQPLAPAQAAVLAACDGRRSAVEIAADVIARGVPGLASERQVLLLLQRLEALEIIEWGFRLPVDPFAADALRRQLQGVEDEPLRRACLEELETLEGAAAAVGRAAGDAEGLDRALERLEDTFTAITDTSATRSAGRLYAARTLVYEDCRRDCTVRVGSDLRERLGDPLSLVLDSIRWYTCRVAERSREEFHRAYRELVREGGSPRVDAQRFWVRVQPVLFEDQDKVFNDVQAEFTRRWWSLVDPPEGARRVELRSADLAPRVAELFPASHPGWHLARYMNPDLMIAAPDAAAIRDGDLRGVLGEVHIGVNTMNAWVFMAQHPNREAVAEHVRRDLPEPRVIPLAPKHWPTLTTRTQMALVSERDYYVASTRGAAGFPLARPLPISELVVEEGPDGLRVLSRDGALGFDVVEFYGEALSFMANDGFRLFPKAPHVPRVQVDDLVIGRESWSVPAEELEFAREKEEVDRWLGARRWARRRGLPRFLFAKVPVEKKPFYVDLESPIYLDLFAKTVRRTLEAEHLSSVVTVSEMLPAPDQLWLTDAAGGRYTSELRVLAVDRTG